MTRGVSRKGRPFGRHGSLTWSVFAVTLVIASVAAFLSWVGYRESRKIQGRPENAAELSSTDPGYLERVAATPVALYGLLGGDRNPTGYVLTVERSDTGAFLWLTRDAIVGDATMSLDATFVQGGIGAVQELVESAIGMGIEDARTLNEGDIAAALGTVERITIDNPDALSEQQGDQRVAVYPNGVIELGPDDMARYLTFGLANATEPFANPGIRFKLVFDAVLKERSAPTNPLAITGLARLIARGYAAAPRVENIPLVQLFGGSIAVDNAVLRSTMAELVDFPRSAFSGQRPTTKILSASGQARSLEPVALAVARLGATVMFIGNAPTIEPSASSIVRYNNEAFEPVARSIADHLGIEPRFDPEQVDTELVVVVGSGQNTLADVLTAGAS